MKNKLLKIISSIILILVLILAPIVIYNIEEKIKDNCDIEVVKDDVFSLSEVYTEQERENIATEIINSRGCN